MGYFDSPKNRAIWNRELDRLKEEKELRRQGLSGSRAAQEKEDTKPRQAHPGERITFRQLLADEQSKRQGIREQKRAMTRTREFSTSKNLDRSMEKGR